MSTPHPIHVDGHRLAALSLNPSAPGSPIILIHGISASVNFWSAEQFPIFCKNGPTYLLSLPGHYPAVFPPELPLSEISPERIAHLLGTAIQHLVGDQPVTLVGHSTGGFAALCIAAHKPELVGRVASISGFAQGRWIGTLGLSQRLARSGTIGHLLFKLGYKAPRLNRSVFRVGWRSHLADAQTLSTYKYFGALIDRFYPDYRQIDLEAMLKYFSVMPDIDISDQLCRIQAPTLALTGDRDPTVPPSQTHLIAQKVPKAELAVIPGSGHFLFMENPQEYRRILSNWLRQEDGCWVAESGV